MAIFEFIGFVVVIILVVMGLNQLIKKLIKK
jgi:uncharacterized protein with PQ loop repeat